MEIKVKRIALKATYTIGKLYVDGQYVCDTLEPHVADVNKNGRFDNGEVKVKGKTAIPYGKYMVSMVIKSRRFSNFAKYPWAKPYDGYLPRLIDVPCFDGVLLHVGCYPKDSSGCLLIGQNKEVGKLCNSVKTFSKLMDNYLIPASKRKEGIAISIE